jgi:hypothetical protein
VSQIIDEFTPTSPADPDGESLHTRRRAWTVGLIVLATLVLAGIVMIGLSFAAPAGAGGGCGGG